MFISQIIFDCAHDKGDKRGDKLTGTELAVVALTIISLCRELSSVTTGVFSVTWGYCRPVHPLMNIVCALKHTQYLDIRPLDMGNDYYIRSVLMLGLP